jgi:hypothetical protein
MCSPLAFYFPIPGVPKGRRLEMIIVMEKNVSQDKIDQVGDKLKARGSWCIYPRELKEPL